MCLYVLPKDMQATKEFKKKHEGKEVTFYKIFKVDIENGHLISPHQYYIFEKKKRYSEKNKIDKHKIRDIQEYWKIEGGCFHGYTNTREKVWIGTRIPIKVRAKDIVSFGTDNEVCFKSFRITDRTWNKLFR